MGSRFENQHKEAGFILCIITAVKLIATNGSKQLKKRRIRKVPGVQSVGSLLN